MPMTWVTRARVMPPLAAGDIGLDGGLPGFEVGLPLDGLPQKFNHSGRIGVLRRLGSVSARRDGAYDPVGGHSARQGADFVVLENPTFDSAQAGLGPEGEPDRLCTIGGRAFGGVEGQVKNAVPDLGPREASLAVGRPTHSGGRLNVKASRRVDNHTQVAGNFDLQW